MKKAMNIDELRNKSKEIDNTIEALTEEINRWLILILLEAPRIEKVSIFCFNKPGGNNMYNVEMHWPYSALNKKIGYHWFSEATIKAVIKNFKDIWHNIKNKWKFSKFGGGSFEIFLWEEKKN